jgi:acetolactate decarboxylase
MKIILAQLLWISLILIDVPEVKVSGALKNVMMQGDLSAHIDLDTLNKTNLYGLGPMAGLKGELMIMNGQVFSSENRGNTVDNQTNKILKATMLVYSRINKWRVYPIETTINDFSELEHLVEATAQINGYDVSKPFAFKIETIPQSAHYHIIGWANGIPHTMDNHKQFAITDSIKNKSVQLLGFYSPNHKGIFTHHSSNVHVHIRSVEDRTVGHLDAIHVRGKITVYLPEM